MTTAIEGTQIPISSASKKQLREFLTHLGGTPTNFDNEVKLIEKIRAQDYDAAHIIVGEPAPAATKAAPGKPTPRADIKEPTCDLTIHTAEGPGGKRHVFVGVNGKAMLIPRGKRSDGVKIRYLEALNLAQETKFEFDEDAKANLPRDMPSYSFQVHRMPDDATIAAWHAHEAHLEAAANKKAA
jgi:hypothetical protein